MDKDTEKRVVERALSFFHAWEGLGEGAAEEFSEILVEAIEGIMEAEGMESRVAWGDVSNALVGTPSYLDKGIDDASDQELEAYVRESLLTERAYTGVFPLYDAYNFPDGLSLGHGHFTVFDHLPDEVKEELTWIWKRDFRRHPGAFRSEGDYLKDRKSAAFIEVEVRANAPGKALELATEATDDSLNVLRGLFGRDFPLTTRLAYSLPQVVGHRPGEGGLVVYKDIFRSFIERNSQILTKADASDIEKRLRTGLRLWGLGVTTKRPEVRFILLMSGLEAMLLGPDDRDFLGHRLSEKVAFLLEDTTDRRIRMYRRVKRLYAKRSAFVHRGANISEYETEDVKEVSQRITSRLGKLLGEGHSTIQSIDELVQNLRFQ